MHISATFTTPPSPPVCLRWEIQDNEWQFLTGWPDVSSEDPNAMSLRVHSHIAGLGYAITAFEGVQQHRLIFACTPPTRASPTCSTIWWPQPEGETSDVPPPEVQKLVEKRFLQTVWDDLSIWRYQKYVERPRSTGSTPNRIWPCAAGHCSSTTSTPTGVPATRRAKPGDGGRGRCDVMSVPPHADRPPR